MRGRYLYCGHGEQRYCGFRFTTIADARTESTWPASRLRPPRCWPPVAAHRATGGLDQKGRTPARRESMGRFFPSLDDERRRPTHANEKGKDPRTCVDGKARGPAEARRVYRRIHRQAEQTRQLHHDVRRPMESIFGCQGWSVVKEDEGGSPVHVRQACPSRRWEPRAKRSHVDIAAVASEQDGGEWLLQIHRRTDSHLYQSLLRVRDGRRPHRDDSSAEAGYAEHQEKIV